MIHLITGVSGSGKTEYLCKQAVESITCGKRCIFIVPEYQAMDTEQKITDMLDGKPSTELEVLNFKRLCNSLFRVYGGLSYSYITNGGKALIMWKTLSVLTPHLKEFAPSKGNNTDFIGLMLGAVEELKRSAVTPKLMEAAVKKLKADEKNSKLAEKLSELSLIYSEYSMSVAQFSDDAADDLVKAEKLLEEHNYFNGADVYFDSFEGLSAAEYAIVRKITEQAENVYFTFPLAAKENSLFKNTADFRNRIRELCKRLNKEYSEIFLEKKQHLPKLPLEYIDENLFSPSCTEVCDNCGQSVRIIKCRNPYEECEAIANDICKKIYEGASYRDIAIAGRGIDSYRGIIDITLEKYGIPYFISERTDITSKPLIKLILTAFAVKNRGFATADVISYAKTGLAGLDYDEISLLASYAELWNIRGKKMWCPEDGWQMSPDGLLGGNSGKNEEKLEKINEIREKLTVPLCDFFARLDDANDTVEFSKALYDFLLELKIPEKLNDEAQRLKTVDEAAGNELSRLWKIFVDSLDMLTSALPEFPVTPEIYVRLLSILFEETDIGRIPNTVDEVTVRDAARIGTSVKHLYILGANEGIFPKTPAKDKLFGDADRALLCESGLELGGDTEYIAAQESFYFYKALTSARETLVLTYSEATLSGNAMKPSRPVRKLFKIYSDLDEEIYAGVPVEERLWGKGNIYELAAETDNTRLGEAIRQYLSEEGGSDEIISRLGHSLVNNGEIISKATLKEIFTNELALSQAKIDKFVKCKFSYYCTYLLGIGNEKCSTVDAASHGDIIHGILENFVRWLKTENRLSDNVTDEEINDVVDKLFDGIFCDDIKKSGIKLEKSRLAYTFTNLRKITKLICRKLTDEFAQSEFKPEYFELTINAKPPRDGGKYIEPITVELDDGSKAYVCGKIDRVDVYEEGNEQYIRIVDYKSSKHELKEDDIERGLSIQLLLYLSSVLKKGLPDGRSVGKKMIPAGVLYYTANPSPGNQNKQISPEEAEELALKSLETKGFILNNTDIAKKMDKTGNKTYIPVKFRKNGEFDGGYKSSLKTEEEFDCLCETVENKVKETGNKIKSGDAQALPLDKDYENVCGYCDFKPVCRHFK